MASIQKRPDGRWRARFVDREGKEHAKHFTRKADGQNWLDEIASSMLTGMYVAPKAGRATVAEFVAEWRDRQAHRERTAENFETILRLHVLPELGPLRLEVVTARHIQKLVNGWTRAGAAASTVEHRYTLVAMIFKAAGKDRRIPITPCDEIRLPPIAPKSALVPITTDTVLALRDAMPRNYRGFVTTAAGSGLRRGEMFGLTQDRVSVPFKMVRVDRQLGRGTRDNVTFAEVKTGASNRNVAIAQVVIDGIEEHIEEFGVHASGLLFCSQIGTPLRPSTLWEAWNRAAREVGTDATPHDLRHYFASMQIRAGTSIKSLQLMLGHKSATETWDTYGHLVGDEDERARAVIQAALGAPSPGRRLILARSVRLHRVGA